MSGSLQNFSQDSSGSRSTPLSDWPKVGLGGETHEAHANVRSSPVPQATSPLLASSGMSPLLRSTLRHEPTNALPTHSMDPAMGSTSLFDLRLPTSGHVPPGQVPATSNAQHLGMVLGSAESNEPVLSHFSASNTAPLGMNTSHDFSLSLSDSTSAVTTEATTTPTSELSTVPEMTNTDPSRLLPGIGGVVNELAYRARDARMHFDGGQFEKCSGALESIKEMLRRVGEMGIISMSMSNDAKMRASRNMSPTLCPQVEQQLDSAAVFSVIADAPEPRKRRIHSETLKEAPSKAHRVARATNTRGRSHSDLSEFMVYLPRNPGKAGHVQSLPPRPLPSSFGQGFTSNTVSPPIPNMARFEKARMADMVPTRQSTTGMVLQDPALPRSPPQPMSTTIGGLDAAPLDPTILRGAHDGVSAPIPPTGMSLPLDIQSHESWTPDSGSVLKLDLQLPGLGSSVANDHRKHELDSTATERHGDDMWENFQLGDQLPVQPDFTPDNELTKELKSAYDTIFRDYLTWLCSNLDATDDRGEMIHQTFAAKKMARLEESNDFRPFKFRIQPFTRAFQVELQRRGLNDEDSSVRLVKPYLWTHSNISRYNEDGRKNKSKGTHVWNVMARRLSTGGWEFLTFAPKITAAPSTTTYLNKTWSWSPRIWDPQTPGTGLKAVFSFPTLPPWLCWNEKENVLSGTPTNGSEGGQVCAVAMYVQQGQVQRLEHSFYLHVLSQPSAVSSEESSTQAAPNPVASDWPLQMLLSSTNTPSSLLGGADTVASEPAASQEGSLRLEPLAAVDPAFAPPMFMERSLADSRQTLEMPALHGASGMRRPSPLHASTNLQGTSGLVGTPVLNNTPSLAGTPLAGTPSFVGTPTLVGGPNGVGTPLQGPSTAHGPYPAVFSPAGFTESAGESTSRLPTATASPAAGHPGSAAPVMQNGATPVMQMWNAIEQRQREQASQFMLLMPQRPPVFSLNEHAGQGTPMSNMPGDMSATLPSVNDSS